MHCMACQSEGYCQAHHLAEAHAAGCVLDDGRIHQQQTREAEYHEAAGHSTAQHDSRGAQPSSVGVLHVSRPHLKALVCSGAV